MDKPLTVQAIKKLSLMSYEQKLRLFARCCILKQNSQISGILNKAVGIYDSAETKAEIVHHLYDENDIYKYSKNYNQLLNMMKNKENVYNKFDCYTLCAYVLYFDKFIELSQSARNIYDVRKVKEQAYHFALDYVDCNRLNANYIEDSNLKTESMLKKEYRKALISYLKKDLDIKNSYKLIKNFLTNSIDLEKAEQEYLSSRPLLDINKTYANQVEEYRDSNGQTYYLDADGNLIDYNEIEDYKINGIRLSATANGLVELSNQDEYIK